MCLRPASTTWRWSGAFHIDEAGDFGIRLHAPDTGTYRVIPVVVKPAGSSVAVVVGNANTTAPYRLENRCKEVRVLFKQKDVWTAGPVKGFDVLDPQQVKQGWC